MKANTFLNDEIIFSYFNLGPDAYFLAQRLHNFYKIILFINLSGQKTNSNWWRLGDLGFPKAIRFHFLKTAYSHSSWRSVRWMCWLVEKKEPELENWLQFFGPQAHPGDSPISHSWLYASYLCYKQSSWMICGKTTSSHRANHIFWPTGKLACFVIIFETHSNE